MMTMQMLKKIVNQEDFYVSSVKSHMHSEVIYLDMLQDIIKTANTGIFAAAFALKQSNLIIQCMQLP